MKKLRDYTNARVGLGSVGHSMPTHALLDFNLDHARARDAVHRELGPLPVEAIAVRSAARDRAEYLRRPDLGRRLSDAAPALVAGGYDASLVIADGLSALAVERYALRTIEALHGRLKEDDWKLAPLVIARQARVALGDEIGARLGARMVVMLIGERPGLSSPDSLGAYLTYAPRGGRTDAERNCISNIRDQGLAPELAAYKLWFLMTESRRRKLSGVDLKEDAPMLDGA